MEKISNQKLFIRSPHFVYILIIIGLFVFGAFKNNEWNQEIENEKNLQKELEQRVNILLSEINTINKKKDSVQRNINYRKHEIDSLKKAIKKIHRFDFRSVPFNERNRAIEIKAAEE